jgi:hypothetical protein
VECYKERKLYVKSPIWKRVYKFKALQADQFPWTLPTLPSHTHLGTQTHGHDLTEFHILRKFSVENGLLNTQMKWEGGQWWSDGSPGQRWHYLWNKTHGAHIPISLCLWIGWGMRKSRNQGGLLYFWFERTEQVVVLPNGDHQKFWEDEAIVPLGAHKTGDVREDKSISLREICVMTINSRVVSRDAW